MLPTGLGADIFKDRAESRLTRGIRMSSAQDYGGPVLWQKQLLARRGHGFVTSTLGLTIRFSGHYIQSKKVTQVSSLA